jgi:hypothetical protein
MLRQSRQISRLSRNSLNSGNIAHQTTVLSLAEQPQRQVVPQRQLIRSAFGSLPCGYQHSVTVRSAR